jgi:hypothetical protein
MHIGCHFFSRRLLWSKKTVMKIFLSFHHTKRVSLTSNRLVLDNASVHGSQCPDLLVLILLFCRPAANFSVTKMQEENSMIQSPCFFELADKFVAHLVPN